MISFYANYGNLCRFLTNYKILKCIYYMRLTVGIVRGPSRLVNFSRLVYFIHERLT